MEFPIHGSFISKRGITWFYTIYSDLKVEQWHKTIKRCAGGWKDGPDVYSPNCTKELKEHIKTKYGIDVKN